jgi:hypothetical protein
MVRVIQTNPMGSWMMSNMSRLWFTAGAAGLMVLGAALAFRDAPRPVPLASSGAAAKSRAAKNVALDERFGQRPLSFERNQGQADDHVAFLSRGPGYALFLGPAGAVFSLEPQRAAAPTAVRMALIGGNPNARIEGLSPQPGKSHYLTGRDPSQWQRDVAHFGKVRYTQVYPGVDLVYYGNQHTLEYDFVVAAGADPAQIAVALEGVNGMKLDADGNLLLATTQGDLVQHKPVVYQQVGGTRHAIEGRYALLDRNRIGFRIGDYDRGRELVIDPEIVYSTYLGGGSYDYGNSIAVDGAGNVYVAGMTGSHDFPTSAAMQPSWTSGSESSNIAFVTKFNAFGELVYSTYLGGGDGGDKNGDGAVGIEVSSDGGVTVFGSTSSSNFPTVNAVQAELAGAQDFFLAKLDPAGSALTLSTYFGGRGVDQARDLSLDSAGNIYVVGDSGSDDFPLKNPLQETTTVDAGPYDAVVAKFNASGGLVYSTYLGGSGSEQAGGITEDSTGAVYISGSTASSDFPVTARRLQNYGGGGWDVFATKINPAGTALVYSTFVGGEDSDLGGDIVVDATGLAYLTGSTYSTLFPVVHSLDGSMFGSLSPQAFVTTLNATGDGIVFSTPLQEGAGKAIALGSNGDAYVTGVDAYNSFAFVSKTNPVAGTGDYDLGIGIGIGRDIAIDPIGNVYLTGSTDDSQFPVAHAFQPTFHLGDDGFVVKLGNVAPHDFDADGRSDVVWRNSSTGSDVIWGSADKATSLPMTDISDTHWKIVAIANFDGDLQADVLWRNSATGVNALWPGAEYAQRTNLAGVADQAWKVAGTGDFNGNGADDILWHNDATGKSSLWYPDGSAQALSLTRVSNPSWRISGVGDFNGDGRADILWRNSDTGAGVIWNSGLSYSTRNITRITNLSWQVVAVEDFDDDGVSDLLWRNASTGANTIWLAANYASQQHVTSVAVAWDVEGTGDYDGDGSADILWHNHSTGAGVVWRSALSNQKMAVATVSGNAWQIVP